MSETNGNGYAKKFHLYATAVATIVAMAISVFSYMREMKDDKARAQAGEGLNQQQATIEALRDSVEFNRKLLLQLYFSTGPRSSRPDGRGDDSPGSSPAPRPRPAPPSRGDDHVPPVPELTPPDELFKNLPQVPKQEKRDWKDYEQRSR